MCSYVEAMCLSHNLAQQFLATYQSYRNRNLKIFLQSAILEDKALPKPGFILFLNQVLYSVAWGIVCTMAARMAITSQTCWSVINPIDVINYFFIFVHHSFQALFLIFCLYFFYSALIFVFRTNSDFFFGSRLIFWH